MYKKILKLAIIFVLIFNWVFGYPPIYENFWRAGIWQNPQIPPKIQEAQADTEIYDTAATHVWHSPVGVTSVDVECWGGGGAGGGNSTNKDGAGGGGGGAYAKTLGISISADTNYDVIVGAGGAGVSGGDGGNGGESYFHDGTSIKAKGGTGGKAPVGGAGGLAGAGGTGSTGADANKDGGAGGEGKDNVAGVGGGGGEAGGSTDVGGVGASGASGGAGGGGVNADGGDGGAGGNGGADGSIGFTPGGGGGGSGDYISNSIPATGGAGFTGKCILTWTGGNPAPTVDTVSISPTPNITLNADSTKQVTITATITDNSGCEDVFTNGSMTAVFYDAGAVADTCSQNDNNCYPSITLTEVGNTCDGASDYTGDASATVDVWFIANPSSSWTAKATATDAASSSGSNTSTVTIDTLVAFKLDVSTIPYGTINPENVSAQQTVLVTAIGNAAIDVNLSGTNMTWSTNTILVGQQKYSASTGFNWESAGTALTGDATPHELSLVKPTAHPSNQTENIYWKLKVPTGKTAGGPYSGTNTFSVTPD